MGTLYTVPPGSIEAAHVADEYKDGAVDAPSLRTLGTGAQQAAAGDVVAALAAAVAALTTTNSYFPGGWT